MDGWQNDSVYGKLPTIAECVKMPPIDESYTSFAPRTKK